MLSEYINVIYSSHTLFSIQIINMTDVQKEEGKKTIVSFVVGLLIGGVLVWAFTGGDRAEAPTVVERPDTEAPANTETEDEDENNGEVLGAQTTPQAPATLPMGDGAVVVNDQSASSRIALESASFPISEGWIGVRDYANGNLGGILGVVRFSESQGLVPNTIILQRPTRAGQTYAVVIFTEDGDRQFNSATDVQLPTIFATFTAK
jgi:hypothetical protein